MSLFVSPAPLVFVPRKAPSLYDAPASPSAYDDEFNSTTLDPKWTLASDGIFDNVSDIDPYAGFSTGHRTSFHSYRKSWAMFQPATSGSLYMHQSVSLPTDCFIWARGSFNFRYSGHANNDHTIGINVCQLAAGLPDATNRVYNFLNESDVNTVQVQAGQAVSNVDASALTRNVGSQGGQESFCQSFEFMGIQKVGTIFHCFVATGTGNWIHIKTGTYAGTINILSVVVVNTSTATPGNMILGVDFVRVLTGKLLP